MRRPSRDGRRKSGGPRRLAPRGPPCGLGLRLVLERRDVLGGRALRALDHVELDLVAFLQAPVSLGLDGAVMAEDVLLAVVTRDEAEALFVVEPLDRSCRTHRLLLLVVELPECDAERVLHHPLSDHSPSREAVPHRGSPIGGPFGTIPHGPPPVPVRRTWPPFI